MRIFLCLRVTLKTQYNRKGSPPAYFEFLHQTMRWALFSSLLACYHSQRKKVWPIPSIVIHALNGKEYTAAGRIRS